VIQLRCPCGYERPVPELYGGPDIQCPNCGKLIPVPVKPPPPPLPLKGVLGAWGGTFIFLWAWLQISGFMSVDIPELNSFDTSRPPHLCAYRPCQDSAKGPAAVHVTFVPSGIRAPVYEDRSIPLCEDHADCAQDRAWPSESSLKQPLQVLLSIFLSFLLIGIPCALLRITGRRSLPKF
jgi:hypothetical protein